MKKWVAALKSSLKTKPWLWAMLGILLLAAGFRFWQLNNLPPGLHADEAANGLDVLRILSGDLRVLYETNGPREALLFYLQTPFVWLLGNTALALRLAPALIGLTAVYVGYLWAAEWFGRRVALLSTLFFASGAWAVTVARDGYRAGLVPLFIALTAWLFTKMIKTRNWYWALLSGVALGAGFYTYSSFRFVLIALLLSGLWGFIHQRSSFKALAKPLGIMAATLLVTLLPLGLYGLNHPQAVLKGHSEVLFTNPELNEGSALGTLAESTAKTALMLNVEGDGNYRHNLGGAPMLNAVVGLLFVLGLLLSARRLRELRYFALLAIALAMLVPAVISAEGVPHGLRAIGVLPAVYLFAAIGLDELINRFKAVFPRNLLAHSVMVTVIATALLMSLSYDYQRYFVAWANAPETSAAFSEDFAAMAGHLNTAPADKSNYVIASAYNNQIVEYLTHGKSSYTLVRPEEVASFTFQAPLRVLVPLEHSSSFRKRLEVLGMQPSRIEVKSAARVYTNLFEVYEN